MAVINYKAVRRSLKSLRSQVGSAMIGFIASGVGAVVRTVHEKLLDHVHAKDYGVTGDGVTVETTELQTAFSRSISLGKKLVISGTPLIDDTITVADGACIEFDGSPGNFTGQLPKSYLLKKNTGSSYVGLLVSGQSALLRGGGVVGQAGNAGDNIQITGNSVRWEHLYSSGAGRDGLRIGEDGSAIPNTNMFYLVAPCCSENGRDGIHVDDNPTGAPNANAGTIVMPFLRLNTRYGLYANNSFSNTVIDILSESNTDVGVYLDERCVQWTFFGGDIEMNTGGAGTSGSDLVLAASVIAAGGIKGNNQFYGTNIGTPPTDNGYLTGRGWVGFPGFGTASGMGTINGEGTWTPSIAGTVTAGTNTYGTRVGYWTKNGRMVTAFFDVELTGNSVAMAGNLRISGLPFQALSSTGGVEWQLVNNVTHPSASYTYLTAVGSTTHIDIYAGGSAAGFSAVTAASIGASNGRLAGVFTYLTPDT